MGSLVRVQAKTGAGWLTVWEGRDPSKGICPSAFAIKFKEPADTISIKIFLNTGKVAGWNEIDAVQLVSKK